MAQMPPKPEYDIDRLPVWAKRYVESLEDQLTRALQIIDDQRDGDPYTNVWVDNFEGANTLLPKDSHVVFELQTKNPDSRPILITAYEAYQDPGWLTLRLNQGGQMIAASGVSNSMRIGGMDR